MTEITVAALQCAFSTDTAANIAKVSDMVRDAAGRGAQVVLPNPLGVRRQCPGRAERLYTGPGSLMNMHRARYR